MNKDSVVLDIGCKKGFFIKDLQDLVLIHHNGNYGTTPPLLKNIIWIGYGFISDKSFLILGTENQQKVDH